MRPLRNLMNKSKRKPSAHAMTEDEKKYWACEKRNGHRWYDTNDIYEKCTMCGHERVQKNEEYSAIHVKKDGDGEDGKN